MEGNAPDDADIVTVDLGPMQPWPSWTSEPERLKRRVLAVLETQSPPHDPPGFAWWAIRQAVTGRVSANMLREVTDELIADGLLIEFWQHPGTGGAILHRFVLVHDHTLADLDRVVRVRASREVLARLDLPNPAGGLDPTPAEKFVKSRD